MEIDATPLHQSADNMPSFGEKRYFIDSDFGDRTRGSLQTALAQPGG